MKRPALPKRKANAKKGDHGRILIVGGSEAYVGAPALAGLAALRAGCDWVTVAAPEKVGWAIHCLTADLVVHKLKGKRFASGHVKEVLKLAEKHDIVVLGNGMGLEAKPFVRKFVRRCPKPLVIDADAIKVLSVREARNALFTPHAREFEMLLKNSRVKNARALQKILGTNSVLLKGPVGEIITSGSIIKHPIGKPPMTKAGTGDVLAGMCAGFYGQTKDLLSAAKLGMYYHALVCKILLKKKKGFTFVASDIAEEMGRFTRR